MEGLDQNQIHALEVRNNIQAKFAERAGEDLVEWIEHNAKQVGSVIDEHPEIVELFDTSPDEALNFIERKLQENTEDITH